MAGFSTRFISRHASRRPPTSPRRRPHPSCMSDSMFSIALPLARSPRPFRVIPGFGITLGFTLLYLSLLVLIPLSAVFLKTFTLAWEGFWQAVTSPRVIASYRLSFGVYFLAADVNMVFGAIVARVLVP